MESSALPIQQRMNVEAHRRNINYQSEFILHYCSDSNSLGSAFQGCGRMDPKLFEGADPDIN
jgi:hypothetical protein